MVVVIKKEDVVGAVKTTAAIGTSAPASSNDLDKIMAIADKVNAILSNPTIGQILARILARYGIAETAAADKPNKPAPSNFSPHLNEPQNPVPIINISNQTLNPEKIYKVIVDTIDATVLLKGNITLSEAKTNIVAEKESILKLISDAIKS